MHPPSIHTSDIIPSIYHLTMMRCTMHSRRLRSDMNIPPMVLSCLFFFRKAAGKRRSIDALSSFGSSDLTTGPAQLHDRCNTTKDLQYIGVYVHTNLYFAEALLLYAHEFASVFPSPVFRNTSEIRVRQETEARNRSSLRCLLVSSSLMFVSHRYIAKTKYDEGGNKGRNREG